MRESLRRLCAAPALHFLVIGAALLGADRRLHDRTPAITITRADRARLREDFAEQWGRLPAPAEERALLRTAIDDEVLYREALTRGLDRQDPLVRTRLARLAAFVDERGGEDDLGDDARRLGLDRSDLVVRRHLIQTMRLAASRSPGGVSEAEAADWYEAQRERFAQPPRIDLEHVYLGRERHGDRLAGDAAALLERLRGDGIAPDDAPRLGDAFMRGPSLKAATAADLDRTFGPGFADALARLPAGEWQGPIPSAYGLHLVWVRQRTPATVAEFDAVRNQVVHARLKERERGELRHRLGALRRHYTIVVEGLGA